MRAAIAALLIALLTAAADPPPPSPDARHAWGFDRSDIAPDPAVRFGVLANGMRYAVLRNDTPRGVVAIRLRVAAGAADDGEGSRGEAHLLEHLAYMGSRHVPEGALYPLLERSGLAAGPDINASTFYAETIYKLDLPRGDDALVDTALMLMRETASELILAPAAIERAKAAVASEIGGEEAVESRLTADQAAFFAPGSAVVRGPAAGVGSEVRAVDAATLRAFYDRYYAPARTTLIVVGDVDPAAIEARILARFGDWRARGPASAGPAPPRIDPDRPSAAHLFVDPAAAISVAIASVGPPDAAPDSAALRDRHFAEYVAGAMLDRRLARLARGEHARFLYAGSGISDYFGAARIARIDVSANGGDWRGALETGEQELRRILSFGFTQAELDEQLRIERERLATLAQDRRSAALADTMVAMLETGTIFTRPQEGPAAAAYLAQIRLADVDAAFRAAWARPGRLIHLSSDEAIAGGEAALAAAWAQSARVAVAAPADAPAHGFAYADFGPPGAIAADGRIADLGIRTIRFANNVRLNVKQDDFEPGRVRVSLRMGGGMLEFPQSPDGLPAFMASAFAAGGTRAHSQDELESIMAGRAATGGIDVLPDAFGGFRQTNAQDLEAQLELLAAYVVAPGYRGEAEAQWRGALAQWLPGLDGGSDGIMVRDVPRILAGGDTRFGVGAEAGLRSLDFAALRPVIAAAFARGPIEIGIVGDVDEARAIRAVARTFGALGPRLAGRPRYAAGAPHFPARRAPLTLTHDGAADDALAAIYWPTPGDGDPREAARLDLLGAVMWIEVRDALGAAYAPVAMSKRWSTWPAYGYFAVQVPVAPDGVEAAFAAVDVIAARLAETPPAADLVARARNPMLERLARQRRDNSAWVRLAGAAQSRPADLNRFRNAEAVLRAVTPEEIMQTARRYLRGGAALRIRILPR